MPELPEVEHTVRWLRAQIPGKTFESVTVLWDRMIAEPAVSKFRRQLRGNQVEDVSRRGKYIIVKLDSGNALLMHLRMSGLLRTLPVGQKPDRHDRILFRFSDGSTLAFQDTRKFGRVSLVADPLRVLGCLGIEPLSTSFTGAGLQKLLSATGKKLKPFLLDQRYIAGLGNIYVDESLWLSGIHPMRLTNSLCCEEVKALYRNIRSVLRTAIAKRGTDFGDNVAPYGGYVPKVYGREGQPCYRCGGELKKIVVAQRGTHFCHSCQR